MNKSQFEDTMMEMGDISSKDLKQRFLDEYGISMQIPAFYIQDAKIFPSDPKFSVQVVNYVLPDTEIMVNTFEEDSENNRQMENLADIFDGDKYKFSSLKLMEQTETALLEISEVSIQDGKKVFMKFSPDGRYLALHLKQEKIMNLKIYKIEDNDINDLMSRIQNEEPAYLEFINHEKLQKCKGLEWDFNNRFLACYGSDKLNIINVEACDSENLDDFELNRDLFTAILDVQMVSDDEGGYRCEVAASVNDQNQIVFFSIQDNQEEVNMQRSITYFNEDISNLDVKISEDFMQAVLVNKTENYLLSTGSDGLWHQHSLSWLRGREIRKIYSNISDFIFVCCKEYDRDLDIFCSFNDKFKVSIPRSIEPGIINVFDVFQEDIDDEGYGSVMHVLSLRDEEFYVDNVNLQAVAYNKRMRDEGENEEPQQELLSSFLFMKYRGFSASWPYIAFQGMESAENYVWLINNYKPNVLNRIAFPEHNVQIS